MPPLVRVPKSVAGTAFPCYAEASESTPAEALVPNRFQHQFSYNPDGTRDVELECPCGDGYLTVTVNEKQKVLKLTTFGCGASCENNYANGQYDEAVGAAIAEAQRVEDEGPTEEQLERLYDTNGSGSSDLIHRMAEARKLK